MWKTCCVFEFGTSLAPGFGTSLAPVWHHANRCQTMQCAKYAAFLSLAPVWHQGFALVWHQFGTMQTVAKPCNGALLQLSTPLPALADRQRPPLPADRPSPPAAHPPSADRCRCCPSRAAVTSCPGWWPAHTQTLHPAGHSGQVALEKGGYVRRRHTLSHPLANQVVLVGPHMGVANRANRHPGADTPEQTLSAAVLLP